MSLNAIEIMKWLNFFLMAGLIGKFAIPPLLRWLDSESDATQASSQEATQKQAEAKQWVEQSQKKMENFDKDADAMKLLAVRQVNVLMHTIKTETEEEIHRLRQFAEYEIQSIQTEAKNKIHQETVLEAIAVSQKNLSSALTENDQRRWIHQFFEQFQRY